MLSGMLPNRSPPTHSRLTVARTLRRDKRISFGRKQARAKGFSTIASPEILAVPGLLR
jgi:hypothetical protein